MKLPEIITGRHRGGAPAPPTQRETGSRSAYCRMKEWVANGWDAVGEDVEPQRCWIDALELTASIAGSVHPRRAGGPIASGTRERGPVTGVVVVVTRGDFRADVRLRALAERQHAAEELFVPALQPAETLEEMLLDAESRRTDPVTKARVVMPEEKGSDVNLGSHLLYDAVKGRCTKAIVVTNDAYLCEPVRLAVSEGVPVGIVNPHRHSPTSRKLLEVASFEIPLRPETVQRCQMPVTVTLSNGKEIHKPRQWRG